MKSILSARNVVKIFGRANDPRFITALNDVSIEVFQGETVGLVGESGSGKTTISRIMIGIETATHGEVFRDGRLVDPRADWRDLRRHIIGFSGSVYGTLPHNADWCGIDRATYCAQKMSPNRIF